MKFEIKGWVDGRVLFSMETTSMKLCVEEAVKSGADLSNAHLREADLRDVKVDAPTATPEQAIENLDRVREIILDDPKRLFMGYWHDAASNWQSKTCAEEALCGTTHCLAGWLQVCSTDEAIRKLPPAVAGTLLAPVAASMFYKKETDVIAWLERREYA